MISEKELDEEIFNGEFSNRAINALDRANIKTYRELRNFGFHELRKIKNCGMKTCREIAERVYEYKKLDILPPGWTR